MSKGNFGLSLLSALAASSVLCCAAYAQNEATAPLNAIKLYFAKQMPNEKDVVVLSMQQAGNTILASVGIADTGSTIVLKRNSDSSPWVVKAGTGGAIPSSEAQRYGLTQTDLTNFAEARFSGLVFAPGFRATATPTAQVQALVSPSEPFTITLRGPGPTSQIIWVIASSCLAALGLVVWLIARRNKRNKGTAARA